MGEYITKDGLYWKGVLRGIKKATNPLQPIFEAITNSLESIDLRRKKREEFDAYITLDLFFNATTTDLPDGLVKACISDNGIGFDDENYRRIQVYKDYSKGYGNRGSGRIQLIKSFLEAHYHSVYKSGDNNKIRDFVLSSTESYLQKNSILQVFENAIPTTEDIMTTLTLRNLKFNSDIRFFNGLTVDDFKKDIIDHYILYLCLNRNNLPQIKINFYHIENLVSSTNILSTDIPTAACDDQLISIHKSKISEDMKRIEETENQIDITVKSYKLPSDQLLKNEAKITCKGEVIDSVKMKIECLPQDLKVGDSRFLFLLSSDYFDSNIGDTRDTFEILNRTEFKKKAKNQGQIEEQVILDDIEEKVSEKAAELFTEISELKDNHDALIRSLKETYLLSEQALSEISATDSPTEIVRKAYAYDAKLTADRDMEIHKNIERLQQLDPTQENYQEQMNQIVGDLSTTTTIRDKEALARYVTHRKLVLDLLKNILNKKLDCQNQEGTRTIDEKLIHNLLFKQHSQDPESSNMWLLNEEYLYFKGVSEERLNQIEIDGNKLFREEITEEEERYLNSLGENRGIKRPDILLFPSERKCIIIELKTLNTNLALHLNQINKYAYFIRNFCNPEFVIDIFYGYLIGEALEPRDIRAFDGDFIYDPRFNYCYRPAKRIPDDTSNHDGSLYTEVLQYSVVLERATNRNSAFISKLFPPKENTEEGQQDTNNN